MGGRVGALEAALTRLQELLSTPTGTGTGALERALAPAGERFLQGYQGPAAYQRGASFADMAGLPAQFEMNTPRRMANPEMPNVPTYQMSDPASGKRGYFEVMDYPTLAENFDVPKFNLGVEPYISSGRLPKEGRYVHADSEEFGKGSGAGRRFYGALYGMISRDPAAVNFADVLTRANIQRRNVNMADAIGRDPTLARRLLLSQEQLTGAAGAPGMPQASAVNFSLDWPLEAQMGGLQALGARHTLGAVQGTLAKYAPDRALSFEDLVNAAYGSDNPAPQLFDTLAHRMRVQDPNSSVGSASLRKARVLDDVLSGRPTDPEMFHHIGFRRGGLAHLGEA